jgi:hypothetical protein
MSLHDSTMHRRRLLTGGLATGGLAAVAACRDSGTETAAPSTAPRSSDAAPHEPAPGPTSAAEPSPTEAPAEPEPQQEGFAHPGLLHTAADLERMWEMVAAGQSRWTDGWSRLTGNGRSRADWSPRPLETVVRGGDGQNYPQMYIDVHAAYQNALRWKVTGDEEHAECAVRILNAWSGTLREVTGNADRYLAAGIYGYQFANAGELVRDVDGFELERFQAMLLDVFHPLSDRFLNEHNDACVTNYWANWDLCNMAAIMAIGVHCDDADLFDRAVDYFHEGEGNGALVNAVPFVHDGGLAQWQESGRDQPHSIMGIGLMASICEMAWNQGVDLYGADDNRFAKAAEYVARYNAGKDVPFTTYSWGHGQRCDYREQTVVSEAGRGQVRPVWEMVYHHYTGRQGIAMPNVAAILEELGAEGGGGDYGPDSGGFDTLGFGTLAYTRYAPEDMPDPTRSLG